MPHDRPLTRRGGDNTLSRDGLALSENLISLKLIVDGHFLVFTQPGPIADCLRAIDWEWLNVCFRNSHDLI
jgi:hypothetical protein